MNESKDNLKKILIEELSGENISEEDVSQIVNAIDTRTKEELTNRPPVIALIGTSGVGKSSTINALFGTELPISHFEGCTQKEEEIVLKTNKGRKIVIYDMPGLGESIVDDERHKETYRKILPKCDVVLWILAAKQRGSMTFEQLILRDFISVISAGILDRLVIGVNQIDLMEPNDWINGFNVPSKEQKENIERRIEDIKKKLIMVVPNLSEDRILYYSAVKRYRLDHLFSVMLSAAGEKRAWVLDFTKDIADYLELVDPKYRKLLTEKSK
jgi:predicted GTPase